MLGFGDKGGDFGVDDPGGDPEGDNGGGGGVATCDGELTTRGDHGCDTDRPRVDVIRVHGALCLRRSSTTGGKFSV